MTTKARERTSTWNSLHALGPVRRVLLILRSAEFYDDGTYRLRCVWCDRTVGREVELDHLIPRAEGGTHCAGNLVPACPDCNVPFPRGVPQYVWDEVEKPLTRQLRALARALAFAWYPWAEARERRNREAQRRRDAQRREKRLRKKVQDLHKRRQRRRKEDAAYRQARAASKRAA